jgi:exopolyphosphatase / guanosine-5'-triphosphate,3'-diphosphate pyrophosphatase
MTKAPLIAAIDIGTNSIHLVIASVNSRGMMNIITKEKEVVRLGEAGKDMKYLSEEAMQRGIHALRQFADLARSQNAEIRATATSAVREAENQREFIQRVSEEAGIEVEVISGAEEGRLIYIGALHALPIIKKKTLLIDIGGGSTETIIGLEGEIDFVKSAKLGSIRMTKRFFPNSRYKKEEVEQCRDYIKGEWSPVLKKIATRGFDYFVATSGTIQNLAVMALAARNEKIPDVINGLKVSGEEILGMIEKLSKSYTLKSRSSIKGIDPARADIILGGALIFEFALKFLDIKEIVISSYALREGIVFNTIQKTKSQTNFKNLNRLRYQTVLSICQKYSVNITHASHIRNISLSLFDDLAAIHKLGLEERELLEAAAILHDVGYVISHDRHHKHSFYIINHSIMPGFSNTESEMIANIARYHRKSHPKKKHLNYSTLSQQQQFIVSTLAGILRIAEGVDRRQIQIVSSVSTIINKERAFVYLHPANEAIQPDIELWGARRRKFLLESSLELDLEFLIKD